MDSLWPWLTLAGAGALHGLHPASCGLLALAWRGSPAASALAGWRAPLWLAVGHLASSGLFGIAVAGGVALHGPAVGAVATGLALLALVLHRWRRLPCALRVPLAAASLVLGAFALAAWQGAGLVLVPAWMPLCGAVADGPMNSAGPIGLALAGLAVHLAAMLAVSGLLAAGGARGIALWRRRRHAACQLSSATQFSTFRAGF